MKFFKILLSCAIFIAPFAFADVITHHQMSRPKGTQESCADYLIQIRGEIKVADIKNFSSAVQGIKKGRHCFDGGLDVQLISVGGDVRAAMEIGRIVRQNSMRTIVPLDSECSSACVFILAAGVRKAAIGKVGIHRPFFRMIDSNLSTTEIRKKRDLFIEDIKKYLNEMDIAPSLLELMLGVPPERMRYLSREEMENLRLDGDDPSFNEKQVAEQANFYGLDSVTYRQRNQEAYQKCRPLPPGSLEKEVCRLSTLLSINPQSARNKVLKYQECSEKNIVTCMRVINLER
jgi:hypothetical protein